jgi:RNAse (barnase) inhibitor barstar
MAWRVALILDTETNLNVAVGLMPIWAQTTEKRVRDATEFRDQWDSMWHPDPGFTLITTPPATDLVSAAAAMLPTLAEHHPQLYSVYLYGVPSSERLNEVMARRGFYLTGTASDLGLIFSRPLEGSLKELALDATDWDESNEWSWMYSFYTSFFQAVGAPGWHGRNLDALDDSIGDGGINKLEVPYRIVIRNVPDQNPLFAQSLKALTDLIAHLQSRGCPVQLQIIPRG